MFVGKEVNVDRGVTLSHVPGRAPLPSIDTYRNILTSYITKEQWKGFKNPVIEEALKKAGWPKHLIEEAFAEAAKHPMHRYQKRILISFGMVLLLVAIIFMLASTTILLFVIENIVYIVVGIGIAAIAGIVLLYIRSRGPRKALDEAPQRTLEAKPGEYETDIDLLYKLLLEKRHMKLSELMNDFGVTEKHAVEWSKILENHGLAKLKYPAIGEPELLLLS